MMTSTEPPHLLTATIDATADDGCASWYGTAVTIVDLPDSVIVAIAAYVAADATPITATTSKNIVAPGAPDDGTTTNTETATATASTEETTTTTPPAVPSGITLSMVARMPAETAARPTSMFHGYDELLKVKKAMEGDAAPQFVSRRNTRGAADLMAMRRACRRIHDLMGTVPFWIEMCRHRYGYFAVPDEMTPEQMAALEAEKAAAREKAAAEAKAIEDEKERQRVAMEREQLRAKRRAERMEKQVAAEAERQRLAEEAAAAAAAAAATTTTEEAPTGTTTTTTKDDDGTSSTGGDQQPPSPSPSANNAVGATAEPATTDPSTSVTAPTAPAVTVAVQPAATQPDPEEEEPAAPPSKIATVVVAYSHSRIVLPTGRNDASWWEKIFFDVSHIGCDHCNAFPMEVFFKCLHCNDVYLCENCESHHPRTHLMAKVSTPFRWTQPNLKLHPSHSIHAGICSVCAGPFGEVQYQCSECESYKICSTCRKAGPLEHEHSKFWEVVVPENELYPPGQRGNNPRGASCDGKGSKCMGRCKGINWKCLVCNDYDLCEACEKNREFSCRSYYGSRNTHDMTHPLLKVLDSRWNGTKWILSCPVYRF